VSVLRCLYDKTRDRTLHRVLYTELILYGW